MPVFNTFRTCPHNKQPSQVDPKTGFTVTVPGGYVMDWRECYQCIDEVVMQLTIARIYLKELAEGKFNDNGVMTGPISEPVQGRDFQQIAATGLGACSD